ncbi:FAD-dependent oxidoreductase [Aestuariimicrobium sp. Y1814]|uniref:FAD-dependent oxidoreductase n=1 Tax=Aestuariimicrobium sp. Y1814 TaxID=3418742 RepID=UPI003DA6F15F
MNHSYEPHTSRWDVIIVGGGPAGLSAALMLGRARRRVLVVDAGQPRNRFADHMHGVLGHEGLPPAELARRGRAEAAEYGIEFAEGLVREARGGADELHVVLDDRRTEVTRALLVATGVWDDLAPIPGLAERWGGSVLHCPYCHGHEVRDQRLGVLARTPMGLHQARLLRQWSDRVVLLWSADSDLDPAEVARLRSRGVEVVTDPVVEVVGEGDRVEAVRTAGGGLVELDAIFTAATLRPHDGFLHELVLERTEVPGFGSFVAVDAGGRTSHERVWAVGNVVAPMANVPMVIGAGAAAGAALNGWLVEQEFDRAEAAHSHHGDASRDPAEFWEARYADADRVWSGKVNAVLAEVAAGMTPGRALDLGCGEGGDVVWLAQQGWQATAVDLSPTAVSRGAAAAEAAGLAERTQWQAADLATWTSEPRFDLVTASFLQSWPVAMPREQILRNATGFVAPGGQLLVVSHAAPPSWADPAKVADHPFPSPEQDLATLALDPDEWEVLTCAVRRREATAPDGTPATLDDSVVHVRRVG